MSTYSGGGGSHGKLLNRGRGLDLEKLKARTLRARANLMRVGQRRWQGERMTGLRDVPSRQSDLGRNQVWELRAGRGPGVSDRGGLRHGAGWGGR